MRILREDSEIVEPNRKTLLEFVEYCQAQGFEVPTIVRHIFSLRKASKILDKSFKKATKDDIVRLVAEIEKSAQVSDRTKLNERISLKRFYKWLNGDEEFPETVKWIKTTRNKGKRILPENLLTEDEVKRIAEAAMNQRDRALVLVLYETGCRIGEILSLRIGNVQFDKYGAILLVDGKTGPRRVRIISSAPALANWLDHHPNKDQNGALWISFDKGSFTQPLLYYACRKMLQDLAVRAHISKKVNPHSFRHARASRLANSLTESQMKEYLGWTQDSNMASVYVHLSGRDIDNALLRVNGVKVETKQEDSALRIVKCMRCETDNSPASRFCTKCGSPLDLKTALELEDEEKITDAVMSIFMEDEGFKEFVRSKKSELILALAQQRAG